MTAKELNIKQCVACGRKLKAAEAKAGVACARCKHRLRI